MDRGIGGRYFKFQTPNSKFVTSSRGWACRRTPRARCRVPRRNCHRPVAAPFGFARHLPWRAALAMTIRPESLRILPIVARTNEASLTCIAHARACARGACRHPAPSRRSCRRPPRRCGARSPDAGVRVRRRPRLSRGVAFYADDEGDAVVVAVVIGAAMAGYAAGSAQARALSKPPLLDWFDRNADGRW